MIRPTLYTCCALALTATLILSGCRTGKNTTATQTTPQPSVDTYAQSNELVPPPPRTAARPRLLPGGPTAPLSTPPSSDRLTSPTSRPSLPLPAPPAEDY